MKITNDHHGRFSHSEWHYSEPAVHITDDNGQVWRITATKGGGIQVTALGSGVGDDQIQVEPRTSNVVVLKSTQP